MIEAYMMATYTTEYMNTVKYGLELSEAAKKYRVLEDLIKGLRVPSYETIERPTTDLQHGGNIYAAEYTVQNVTETEYTTENQGQEETQETAAA
jgi:hypothetical protein